MNFICMAFGLFMKFLEENCIKPFWMIMSIPNQFTSVHGLILRHFGPETCNVHLHGMSVMWKSIFAKIHSNLLITFGFGLSMI
jgi:hypothetical protein